VRSVNKHVDDGTTTIVVREKIRTPSVLCRTRGAGVRDERAEEKFYARG
jgi:hypothetical protein